MICRQRVTRYLVLAILLMGIVGCVSADIVAITTSHDGYVKQYNYNVTIDNAFRQSTAQTVVTNSNNVAAVLTAHASANGYYIDHTIPLYSFNTSVLGTGATINSVKFRSSYYTTGTTALGTLNYTVTGANPDNATSFSGTDYATVVNTPLTDTNFTEAQYRAGGASNPYNSTLNAAGLSFINKTGWTTLALRSTNDVDNSGTGITWSAGATSGLNVMFSEYTGTTGDPVLFIDYTPSAGGDTTPPASISNLANSTTTCEQVNWTWTNPADSDFNHTYIKKDDVFYANLSNTTAHSLWTGLTGGQEYKFSAQTVDITGNMNSTVVTMNATPTTCVSPPVAGFSANATSGASPLAVQFNDTSTNTPTNWDWYFGNGTKFSDERNASVTLTTGTYSINLYASNAGGGDWENKTNYITVGGLQHPIFINVLQSPGYLNRTIEPWALAESTIESGAATGRGIDYSVPSTSYLRPGYAKKMAIDYVINGNLESANKTVEALIYAHNNSASCIYLKDYPFAYDLIWQTKNVNSTLTTTNDTLVRDSLALEAERCYLEASDANIAPHNADIAAYTGIAEVGLVLSDYTNESLTTTPSDWEALGGDALWVEDPLHTTSGNQYTYGNFGLMCDLFNYNGGVGQSGDYKNYYDSNIYEYASVYTNVKGTNYFDVYPTAQKFAMEDSWLPLPMGVLPDFGTSGNVKRLGALTVLHLLDEPNRSALRHSLTRMDQSTAPYKTSVLSSPWSSDQSNAYLFIGNYSSETEEPLDESNHINVNGLYNIIRENWSTRADWISFVIWDDPSVSARWRQHQDQFSFEYASHGDLLMPDAGENKYMNQTADPFTASYGTRSMFHNALLFDNVIANYTRNTLYSGNLTYRGITKSTTNRAQTSKLIDTNYVTYIEGGNSNITIEDDSEAYPFPTAISPTIQVNRSILRPFNDYNLVIDRATSTDQYYYINEFRFGSLRLYPGNAATFNKNTLEGIGNVNGTLAIDGSPYNWNSGSVGLEVDTGVSANSLRWNTTNPYNEGVTLELFTAPKTPVMYQRWITRISTYTTLGTGLPDSVAAPQIFFKQPANETLYRVTALLTRYTNETTPTPSELTVTGTGSAMKVISADTVNTDYIYTGLGNSTFANFTSDADTVFIRSNATATYALLINGSALSYFSTSLIANESVQPYIEWLGDPLTDPDTPAASFTKNVTSGAVPLGLQVNDTSTGTSLTSWNWSWGDGNWTNTSVSAERNATHSFASSGVFTVYHIVSNAVGSSTSTGQNVTVVDVPVANFTTTSVNATTAETVTFTDTSTGVPTSWNWTYKRDAGNWTPFSELQSPAVLFNVAGTYSINLTATNLAGADSEVKDDYITITNATSTPAATTTWSLTPTTAGGFIILALNLIGLGFIVGGALLLAKQISSGTGIMGRGGTSENSDIKGGIMTSLFAIAIGGTMLLVSYLILSPIFTIVGI